MPGVADGINAADEAACAGEATGATGAAPVGALPAAEAAGSAGSGGNTCNGGGGSAGVGGVAGFCITAANPRAATNKAMMNHREFLDLGLSSLSKAEFVDF